MIAEVVSLPAYESQVSAPSTRMSVWRWNSTSPARQTTIPLFARAGGFRKARWARSGKGKSGGFRVIYFFVAEPGRVYMAAIFAKSRKQNLSAADEKVLAKLAAHIKKASKGES
jgi:hypothetical protein